MRNFPKKIKSKTKNHISPDLRSGLQLHKELRNFCHWKKSQRATRLGRQRAVTKPKQFWRVPTNHTAQGKRRHHDGQGHSCSEKQECFVAQPSSFIGRAAGKHADLPYHLKKHLAHEIPLRPATPIPPLPGSSL